MRASGNIGLRTRCKAAKAEWRLGLNALGPQDIHALASGDRVTP